MPLKKAASLGRIEPADMMGLLSLHYPVCRGPPVGVHYRVDGDGGCSCLEGNRESQGKSLRHALVGGEETNKSSVN